MLGLMNKNFGMALMVMGMQISSAFAINEVQNLSELREHFRADKYSISSKISQVKIAVLDNGFDGFSPDGGFLPKSAEMLNLTQYPQAKSKHGLGMAQIAWALTGKNADGPKFYLINTNGWSNFKAAVQYVIDNKIDIVLYAQVWPFGSNFDGTGFINEQVTRAAKAGVIWINASGNYKGRAYNGLVTKHQKEGQEFFSFITAAGTRDSLRFNLPFDESEVTLSLSWSDFKNTEEYNSTKDLDVFVYDSIGNLVGSGELIQKGESPPDGTTDSNLSSHARETVSLKNLNRGDYKIKIKAKSQNFVATDRFRIILKSEKPLKFTDATKGSELMPPADNPLAITVADSDDLSSTGPTADGRQKPEVTIDDANISFSNGGKSRGSSNATAIFAGLAAIMKAQEPRLNINAFRKMTRELQSPVDGDLMATVSVSSLHPWIQSLVPTGSIVRVHRRGFYVVLTPQDPLEYDRIKNAGATRVNSDDFIIANPRTQRFTRHPRANPEGVSSPWVEFRQARSINGVGVWKTPLPTDLAKWL